MGIIDTYSDYSLYDVVEGEVPSGTMENGEFEPAGSVEYMGFHVTAISENEFAVIYDGRVGHVDVINADDFDDVLELVDHLNTLHLKMENLRENGTTEELVEFAGHIATEDEELAEESEEHVHVPEHLPEGNPGEVTIEDE